MCGEKKAKIGYLAAERTTDPIGSFSDLAIEKREAWDKRKEGRLSTGGT